MPVARSAKSRAAKRPITSDLARSGTSCASDPPGAAVANRAEQGEPAPHGLHAGTVWLTTAQAAARASYSTRQIKRWIKAGYLKANRLPSPKNQGHLRIRLGDLEALIAHGALS